MVQAGSINQGLQVDRERYVAGDYIHKIYRCNEQLVWADAYNLSSHRDPLWNATLAQCLSSASQGELSKVLAPSGEKAHSFWPCILLIPCTPSALRKSQNRTSLKDEGRERWGSFLKTHGAPFYFPNDTHGLYSAGCHDDRDQVTHGSGEVTTGFIPFTVYDFDAYRGVWITGHRCTAPAHQITKLQLKAEHWPIPWKQSLKIHQPHLLPRPPLWKGCPLNERGWSPTQSKHTIGHNSGVHWPAWCTLIVPLETPLLAPCLDSVQKLISVKLNSIQKLG